MYIGRTPHRENGHSVGTIFAGDAPKVMQPSSPLFLHPFVPFVPYDNYDNYSEYDDVLR